MSTNLFFLIFYLIHNPADVCQASCAVGVLFGAAAAAEFFGGHDLLYNDRTVI